MAILQRLRQVPLVRDVLNGKVHLIARIALTLSAAAVALAIGMIVPAIVEITGNRAREEHLSLAFTIAAILWAIAVVPLWWTIGRGIARAIIAIIVIWAITLPLTATVAMAMRDEGFVIATFMLLGVGATFSCVAFAVHGGSREQREAVIDVRCPDCGYSLRGRTSSQCPECGTTHSLEAIVAAAGRSSKDREEPSS